MVAITRHAIHSFTLSSTHYSIAHTRTVTRGQKRTKEPLIYHTIPTSPQPSSHQTTSLPRILTRLVGGAFGGCFAGGDGGGDADLFGFITSRIIKPKITRNRRNIIFRFVVLRWYPDAYNAVILAMFPTLLPISSLRADTYDVHLLIRLLDMYIQLLNIEIDSIQHRPLVNDHSLQFLKDICQLDNPLRNIRDLSFALHYRCIVGGECCRLLQR
jgi:hypothetical protein